MKSSSRNQRGATLLVAMVMLVVLTLLVVLSIRSGNTQLRIVGNSQVQLEASAATQQVIEQMIEKIKINEDITLIPTPPVTVSVNNASYSVVVAPLTTCINEVPILNADLSTSNPNDVACFENTNQDQAITADGKLTTSPSACKNQQWDIEASIDDPVTGAKTSQVQGITIRVPSVVSCL